MAYSPEYAAFCHTNQASSAVYCTSRMCTVCWTGRDSGGPALYRKSEQMNERCCAPRNGEHIAVMAHATMPLRAFAVRVIVGDATGGQD